MHESIGVKHVLIYINLHYAYIGYKMTSINAWKVTIALLFLHVCFLI